MNTLMARPTKFHNETTVSNIPILDTHQHLIYPDKWPYSWTKDIPQLAGRAFHYGDYLQAIEGTGIAGSIFMETSPDDPHWHDETQFVDQLSRRPGSLICGLIANCRPEDKDCFPKFLESIRNDRLVGLRRFLHAVPDKTSQPAHFVENLRLLEKHRLTFDLCVLPRQIPLAIRLARECPKVQFILDHCGVPDVAAGALDPWRDLIRQLAQLPNVACKISGVLAYAKPGEANADAVRPFVDHCLNVFGWDRVVWGSDWPVVLMTSTLRDWVVVSREIVSGEREVNQRKLFHENAARIYGVQLSSME
jgi:predicted TIM-barrel fold metal-dependent hydrolase